MGIRRLGVVVLVVAVFGSSCTDGTSSPASTGRTTPVENSTTTSTTTGAPAPTTPVTTTGPPAIVPLVGAGFESVPVGAGFPSLISLDALPRLPYSLRREAWAVLGPTTVGHWLGDNHWELFGFIENLQLEWTGPPLFYDIAATGDGSAWVTTVNGVFFFDGTEWIQRAEGLLPGMPAAVEVDDQGRVWIAGLGRDGHLRLALEDEGWWITDPATDFSSEPYWPVELTALANGDIWLAKYGFHGEVAVHDGDSTGPRTEVSIEPVPGMPLAFALGPDGVVWAAGTSASASVVGEHALLSRREGTTWTTLELPEILGPWLLDVAVDPRGVVWVLDGRLFSFDGIDWTLRADNAVAMDMLDDGTIVYLEDDGEIHDLFTIEP